VPSSSQMPRFEQGLAARNSQTSASYERWQIERLANDGARGMGLFSATLEDRIDFSEFLPAPPTHSTVQLPPRKPGKHSHFAPLSPSCTHVPLLAHTDPNVEGHFASHLIPATHPEYYMHVLCYMLWLRRVQCGLEKFASPPQLWQGRI
jgi:hypothetical protein